MRADARRNRRLDLADRAGAPRYHGNLAGSSHPSARPHARQCADVRIAIVRGSLFFFLLLIGLAIGLVVLVARHDQGTIAGLSTDDFSSLIINVVLVVFIGSTVL